jgi:hypothetical protein
MTDFNIYDILSTTVGSNGSLTGSLGNVITASKQSTSATNNALLTKSDVYSTNAQMWLIIGVTSMPAAPPASNATDCAQSLSITKTDSEIIVATRDTRFQNFVSDIQPGDVYVYATGNGANAGIKVKAATNMVEVTAGGMLDFVAIASEVSSNFTKLIQAITTMASTGNTGGPLSFTPPIISNMASSVLQADK